MSVLFSEISLNTLSLKNRLVRSATWDGLAGPKGEATPATTQLLAGLARGGIGLIISGHAFVSPEGRAGTGQLGIYDDSLIPGLAKMVAEVHRAGGHIAVQLAHAGRFANTELTGLAALGPSPRPSKPADKYREMTVEEIRETVRRFVRAALRAREAGFDAVQIHAAHGYLMSQFLSPAFNQRGDDYGGTVENRGRALIETVQEVRSALGPDYPLLAKLNCRDFADNGLELADSLEIGKALERAGLDALEVSGGTVVSKNQGPSRTGIKNPDQEAYFREEAKAFKKALSIPVILVGGIRTKGLAEKLVEQGNCDLISMSRPLIRQPDLAEKWRRGEAEGTTCLSDNLCLEVGRKGKGVYCLTRERQQGKKG